MSDSFLGSLIDTTGNNYRFGLNEASPGSVFFIRKDETGTHGSNYSSNYISLYKGNELKLIHSTPVPRSNISPDWFFPVILIVLIIYTWLRVFYGKFFTLMVHAFINKNISNQVIRDENIYVQRISVFLSIVFNLNVALLLYLTSVYFNWNMAGIGIGFSRFAFFLLLVSVAYALKFLILKICGWLFEQEREMATYVFNIFLINNILGMIFFPIILLLAYNESISFSALSGFAFILLLAGFSWRIFRGIQIGIGTGSYSLLYLFLYLCTLEIAPLMVLIRIIVS
jgi:hypothetical protein